MAILLNDQNSVLSRFVSNVFIVADRKSCWGPYKHWLAYLDLELGLPDSRKLKCGETRTVDRPYLPGRFGMLPPRRIINETQYRTREQNTRYAFLNNWDLCGANLYGEHSRRVWTYSLYLSTQAYITRRNFLPSQLRIAKFARPYPASYGFRIVRPCFAPIPWQIRRVDLWVAQRDAPQ